MTLGELITATGDPAGALARVGLSDLLKAVGIVIGAAWALRTFTIGNRLKSAELLVQVERDYHSHIPALLQIERREDYQRKYLLPIRKTLAADGCKKELRFTPEEQKTMDELESILRYFHVCCNIRQLGIHSGAVEQLCYYYLKVLISEDREYRKDLADYVRYYWPSVYLWAHLVLQPLPKRVKIYVKQMPLRIPYWWSGKVKWTSSTGLTAETVLQTDCPGISAENHLSERPAVSGGTCILVSFLTFLFWALWSPGRQSPRD